MQSQAGDTMKIRQNVKHFAFKQALTAPVLGDVAREKLVDMHTGIFLDRAPEALRDEQVRAREMILEVEHPAFGTVRQVAHPVKTEGVPARPEPAPEMGGDTDRILAELCGLSGEEIAELRAEGAVA